MGMNMPSEKSLLVAIPMDMYRVQTNKFVSGLNFFQKAILKLKYKPQITNTEIAHLLHLEENLVNIIVDQLESQGLITSTGYLTPKGELHRKDSSSLIVDGDKKQVGYIFTYQDGDSFYPFYRPSVEYADVNQDELIISTENGIRIVNAPFFTGFHKGHRYKAPSESEILQLIKHTSYLNLDGESVDDDGLFQIKLVPNDKPEEVYLCTYIYLPKSEDSDTYGDDWLVQDPFGNGNSFELKLFLELEAKHNKALANIIFTTFKDVETESHQRYGESVNWFEEKVSERISIMFGADNFRKISPTIQQFVESVVRGYMRMEYSNFNNITLDQVQIFFLNIQSAIEAILLQDKSEREDIYSLLDDNFSDKAFEHLDYSYRQVAAKQERQDILSEVYKKRILSDTTMVPGILFKGKTQSWKGRSLLDYLMKFIMTIGVVDDYNECPIYSVFKNRIDSIIKIAGCRNSTSHGNHRKDSILDDISSDNVNHYFDFFKNFMSDYINIH